MPHTSRHKEQKSKNLTLFAVLAAIVAVLFGLTVMKISGGFAPQPVEAEQHVDPS